MRTRTRRLRRLLIVGSMLVAVLVSTACVGSPNPEDTLSPHGQVARDQQQLLIVALWIAGAVFFLVEGALVYAVIRFRHRRGEPGLPRQIHGNTRIEIAWTIAPTLLLAGLTIPTVATIYRLEPKTTPTSMQVRVVGHQWWWEFQYTDQGVVTANELHIPLHTRVNLTLNSADVIHAFFVPELAGQLDVVPGHNNQMWIESDRPGTYLGQCTQFCGTSHAYMRFRVMVDPDFDAWLANQKAPPVAPTDATAAGAKAFAGGACIGCHAITGVSQGAVGPNLTHFASRTTLAGSTLDNTPENVAKWLRNPADVKPEAKMPNYHLSDEDINNLVTYLESLK
jgi:cytochrome c oxidase subunit 2